MNLREFSRIVERHLTSSEYGVGCSALDPRVSREEVVRHLTRIAGAASQRGLEVNRLGPFTWLRERRLLVYGPVSKYRVVRDEETPVFYTSIVVSGGYSRESVLAKAYKRFMLASLLLHRVEPVVVRLSVGESVEEVEVPTPLYSLLVASIREQYESCASLVCIGLERVVLSVFGERVYDRVSGLLGKMEQLLGGREWIVASITGRVGGRHTAAYHLEGRLLYTPGEAPTLTVAVAAPPPIAHGILAAVYLEACGAKPDDKLLEVLALKAFEASQLLIASTPRSLLEQREGDSIASYLQCMSFHTLLVMLAGQLATRSILADEASLRMLEEYYMMLLNSLLESLQLGG